MPITQKTAVALLLVFLALLAGAAATLDIAVRPGFERLEAAAHERDLARVSANLETLGEDLRSRTTDYSYWDDTYAFVQGRNPGYVADLTDEWFDDYGLDFIAFTNQAGHTMWSRRRLADGSANAESQTAVRLAAMAPRTPGDQPTVGVVKLPDGQFMMLALYPAVRSDGSGVPRGMVIMGRTLSREAFQQQTQLHIDIVDAHNPPPALRERMARLQDETPQSWTAERELNALFALRDMRGNVIGAIRTLQPREISALGADTARVALMLFAAVLAVVMTVLWFLLRIAFIQRIQRLERHFNAQDGEPQPIAAEPGRRDEITRLTDAYNALVARLRESSAREHAALLHGEAEATANRMKSDFLANVSHELRTPLNAVIGYAELIGEELQHHGYDGATEDLGRITASARHLLALVNEILDLSKIEAGRLEIRPASFVAEEVLNSAVSAVAELAARERVTLSVDIADDLGVAYSDQHRLRQSVANILANACRLSPQGTVTLRASREARLSGDVLRIEITDTGAGMTEGQLKRAFEPFQGSTTFGPQGFHGAGLGLAITSKLLALLGGTLEANSTVGKGSQFTLFVPAILDESVISRAAA
jgi:signal transduction histidine kinase